MSVFDLPMTARPGKDAIAGQDELGRTVYRTVTGERYTMPERTEMPAPTMGQRFENLGGLASRAYEGLSVQGAIEAAKGIGEGIISGIVQGFTAPGRALSGEPVSYGDVLATAGMAQVGAAPMSAPAGSLRSGAMGGGRPPVTFDDVARAMDEGAMRLFHGTTPENYKSIMEEGFLGRSYFTPRRSVAEDYAENVGGDTESVLQVDIPEQFALVDLDLPGGQLLSPEDAALYLDRDDLKSINDFVRQGYSIGVNDPAVISIVRKYGVAGAAAMLGVSAIDVEQALADNLPQDQWESLVVGK